MLVSVPLAICAAWAWSRLSSNYSTDLAQSFNKLRANFLQIAPKHGRCNLPASFAESRYAIV